MDYMIDLARQIRERGDDERLTGIRRGLRERIDASPLAREAWRTGADDARIELMADALYQRPELAAEAARMLDCYPPFIERLLDRIVDISWQRKSLPLREWSLAAPVRYFLHAQLADADLAWAALPPDVAAQIDAVRAELRPPLRTRWRRMAAAAGARLARTFRRAAGPQPPAPALQHLKRVAMALLVGRPDVVRDQAERLQMAVPFSLAFARELVEISASRTRRWRLDPEAILSRLKQMIVDAQAAVAVGEASEDCGVAEVPRAIAERRDRALARLRQLEDAHERLLDAANRLRTDASGAAAADFARVARSVGCEGDAMPAGPDEPPREPIVFADEPPPDAASRLSLRKASESGLVGMAFSGGGIRSATLNLGVLQGLAKRNLLPYVDYLSTVSGGGYVGSWFCAWIKRQGAQPRAGVAEVQCRLSRDASPDPNAKRVAPIRFLREYSNYLTPRLGLLGADTWTMISIWWRNTTLNQTVLLLVLLALLLLPRVLVGLGLLRTWPLVALGFAAFGGGCCRIGRSLRLLIRDEDAGPAPRPPEGLAQGLVQTYIIVPLFVAAVAVSVVSVSASLNGPGDLARLLHASPAASAFAAGLGGPMIDRTVFLVAFVLLLAGLIVVQACGGFGRCFWADAATTARSWWQRFVRRVGNTLVILAVNAASAAAGALTVVVAMYAFTRLVAPMPAGTETGWRWDAVTFGPPLLVLAFCASGVMQVGLLGRNFADDRREWISRLGAWLLIYSVAWLALFSMSVYGPLWVFSTPGWIAAAGGLGWIGSTVGGLVAGKSAASPGLGRQWRDQVAGVAMYVFVAGLLLALTTAIHLAILKSSGIRIVWSGATLVQSYWTHNLASDWWRMALAVIAAGATAAVLAWRFDVNEFSMHHFYKNRLVRCYLGASRAAERRPNAFTGFDVDDDERLALLRLRDPREPSTPPRPFTPFVGPLPIINTTLNIVRGDSLAWQERKAAAFAFTPFYSGYTPANDNGGAATGGVGPDAFRPTLQYAYPEHWGIALGTAMAISGAAASPNQGYQSSPAAAFLMTVFNVRLGWWIGNPRRGWRWRCSSPPWGLMYLLTDLTASASDRSGFVNLSDGGHFDNLGLYELVRRRCRYILAFDAEQDGDMTFGALGGAVRKCRIDLGADIDIQVRRIRPAGKAKRSPLHCAIGAIRYTDGSRGTLVYVKSSLTGDEPADVQQYGSGHGAFPHESTADQWFTESQFESYRALGEHMVDTCLDWCRATPYIVDWTDVPRMFDALWSTLGSEPAATRERQD